jgi:hypothetical protein
MNTWSKRLTGHAFYDGILIHSRGGIGNQLFGLLAGLAIADRSVCRLYVDPSQHRYTPHLPFLLDKFIEKAPPSLSAKIECLKEPSTRIGRNLRKLSIPRRCDFIETSFRYDPSFLSLQSGSCAFGYFQSWRYLEHVRGDRQNELRVAIRRLSDTSITFSSRDIVIHFRRGDYLKPGVREVHGVLPYRYYSEAIASLRKNGYDGDIWAVSEGQLDDLRSLESYVGTHITQLGTNSLWSDLDILISSPALVIANSTFSWMAAWLNEASAPVIAPEPWFYTNQYDTSDLIPPNWLTVKHDFGD